MTARIARRFELHSGVYFSGEFYVNSYDIDVSFNVEAESITEQNIALERIKHYLHDCLEHSVMVVDKEEQAITKFMDAGLRVCILPEEPYDQIIGIMLLLKMNAIAEGRLVATDISVESRMSDGVSCLHSLEDEVGPFRLSGWWNDSSTKINNHKPKNKKIVKMAKIKNDWDELQLSWDNPSEIVTVTTAEIVFANFDKTDK